MEVKVGGLERHRTILADGGQDVGLDVIGIYGANIVDTKKADQGIGCPPPIGHRATSLRQFNIIGHSKDGIDGVWVGSDEAPEVQRTLHTNKPYILLPALSLVAILNGQKDLGIAGGGGVINPIALRLVKEMDNKVSEIHPLLVKISAPIAQNSLDGQARIKLSAECVNHKSVGGSLRAALFT